MTKRSEITIGKRLLHESFGRKYPKEFITPVGLYGRLVFYNSLDKYFYDGTQFFWSCRVGRADKPCKICTKDIERVNWVTPMNFHPRIGTCASGLTVDKSMQSTAMENLWRRYWDLYDQVQTIANARSALRPLFLRQLGVFWTRLKHVYRTERASCLFRYSVYWA